MTREEYLSWLRDLEAKGYDDAEIEAMVQDYLDQPDSAHWFWED